MYYAIVKMGGTIVSIDKQDSIIATAIAVKMDRGCGKRMKGEGGKCVPAGGGRLAQGMNNAVSSGDWGAAQKFGGQIVAHEKRIAQARRKKFRQSAGNAFRGTASALNRSADVIQKTAATAIAAKALHELSKRNQEKKDSYIATAIAVKMDGGCGKGKVGFQGKCIRAKNALKVAASVAIPVAVGVMAHSSLKDKERRREKLRSEFQAEQQAEQDNYQRQRDELDRKSREQERKWAEEERQEKIREKEIISRLEKSRQSNQENPQKEGSKQKEPLRTSEQEEGLRQADEKRSRQLKRWEEKASTSGSQRKNRRRGGRRSRPVTDSLIATAIAIRQDWGKAFRPKRRGNLIRNLGVAGAAAAGLYTFAGSKEKRQQSRQALSSVKNAITNRMPKKKAPSSPPSSPPKNPPSSQSAPSSTGSKYSWKPPKDNDELTKRFNDLSLDSLIATAIAIKMDGCKRGTVGK